MSIAFDTAGTPANGLSDTASIPRGGTVHDLMIVVFGFDGVGAGSGPWIIPNTGSFAANYIGPSTSWKRCCYQDPSASGTGIEVWAAISATVVGTSSAQLTGTLGWNTISAFYAGIYAPSNSINDGAVRAATTAQVSGDNPAAPSVYAFVDELVVACMGEVLTGAPTAPPGYTLRTSHARIGEIAIADKLATAEGDTGLLPFSGTASPSGAKGATATLAIRPDSPAATSPFIAVEFAVAS
jgi:hypothetical protein